MIIVSACLCGVNCKYNGENNLNEEILKLFKEGKAIPVCPEQLGGLSTPRTASEIYHSNGAEVLNEKGKVVTRDGRDVTEEFVKGAEETLKIAKECNAKAAILKERSPSCGSNVIYDGSFKGKKVTGSGVTAEILIKNGIKVYNEDNFELSNCLDNKI